MDVKHKDNEDNLKKTMNDIKTQLPFQNLLQAKITELEKSINSTNEEERKFGNFLFYFIIFYFFLAKQHKKQIKQLKNLFTDLLNSIQLQYNIIQSNINHELESNKKNNSLSNNSQEGSEILQQKIKILENKYLQLVIFYNLKVNKFLSRYNQIFN